MALAVTAKIGVAPAVVVATRAVPRGAVIQASDVQLDRSQPVTGKMEVATRLEEVVGKEAAGAIVAGRPIDQKAIRQPLLVRKGEVVTVYVRSPGVRIRTAGRAQDAGSQGELIAVESLENRQTYFARVTGIQEAEVYARAEERGGFTMTEVIRGCARKSALSGALLLSCLQHRPRAEREPAGPSGRSACAHAVRTIPGASRSWTLRNSSRSTTW